MSSMDIDIEAPWKWTGPPEPEDDTPPLEGVALMRYNFNVYYNRVCTALLRKKADFHKKYGVLATKYKVNIDELNTITFGVNVEYNPLKFEALTMRIRNPKSSANIFTSGKMICLGTKDEDYEVSASAFDFVCFAFQFFQGRDEPLCEQNSSDAFDCSGCIQRSISSNTSVIGLERGPFCVVYIREI
ncbi:hypothetical protein U1Q18_050216 [Sarracenia purpurea var. burkii]